MIKIYTSGCVSCHKAVKALQYKNIPFIVENNYDIVIKKASETIGIVPIFEFDGKIYNEYQIENMVDIGFDFTIKYIEEPVKEEIIKKNK